MAKKKKPRTGPPAKIETPQDEWRMYRWTKEEIELGLEFRKEALIEARNLLKTGSPTIKTFIIKMALDNFGMSATELAKLTEGGGANGQRVNVTVQIASWAAKGGNGAQPQFAAPAHQPVRIGDPIEVDYVASDRALGADAPRSSKPTPPPTKDDQPYAISQWGAPVTKRRFEELRLMGTDMSRYTLCSTGRPVAEGEGRAPAVYSANPSPSGRADDSERDRQKYRDMCAAEGKLGPLGQDTVNTSFKLFDE